MKRKESIRTALAKLQKSIPRQGISLALMAMWMILLIPTRSFFAPYVICGLCGAVALMKNRNQSPVSKKISWITSLCSLAFSVLVFLANYDLFLPLREHLVSGLILLLGGFAVAQNVLLLLYRRLPLKTEVPAVAPKPYQKLPAFLIPFAVYSGIYLLYLFFSAYPGHLSPDSVDQVGQALNTITSNHHPAWHTLIIRGILKLGLAWFGNVTDAVALYSVCQLLFLSAAFAFSLMTLFMAGAKKSTVFLCGLPFAVLPYHVVYSVTMWKDVVFGAAALFLMTFLFRSFKHIGNRTLNLTFLFLFTVAFCVWRSNAWLAMIASVVFFFFYFKKKHLATSLVLVAAVFAAWFMRSPVLSWAGIQQPDFVESLSIPVQQVARVVADDGYLSEEDRQLLEKIVDVDEIKGLYADYISDPIKNEIRSKDPDYLAQHKGEYLKLWVRMGLNNPSSYVKAWVDQTKGYFNSGYSYWIFSQGVAANDSGVEKIPQDNPLHSFFGNAVSKLQSDPLAKPFISIGLWVWILAALGITCLLHRREEGVLFVPLLCLVATLLIATPVYSEFRYAYSIFTTLPFLLAVGTCRLKENKGEKTNG